MILRRSLLEHSFVRFLIVGGLNTFIGLGVTYGLLHLASFSYWGASMTGNAIGAINGYLLNRRFTFASQTAVSRSVIGYVLVIASCYWLSFRSGLRIAQWLVPFLSSSSGALTKDTAVVIGTLIYTLTNYCGQKFIVFRETRKPHESKA